MDIYTNLPDSIHFSTYMISQGEMNARNFHNTYYQVLYEAYKDKLTEFFIEWEQNAQSGDNIAFTFNQVADNPVFNTILSGENLLHKQLISLFKHHRAFLSTFARDAEGHQHDILSYLSSNMLKHWRELCKGNETQDNDPYDDQYLSSFLNMATKAIAPDKSGKVAAHYTIFGILPRGGSVTAAMGEDQEINRIISENENNPFGLYNLLIKPCTTNINVKSPTKAQRVFFDIVSINEAARKKRNATLVNDNEITLSKIIDAILDCEHCSILYDIYEATASEELRGRLDPEGKKYGNELRDLNPLPDDICPEIKNLSFKESSFLMAFRRKLKKYSNSPHNRSEYYKIIKQHVIPELARIMKPGSSEAYIKDAGHLIRPFVQQFIDFCYNLHCAIMCFGQSSMRYEYYTYKTYTEEQDPNDHNLHYTPQRMRAEVNETPIVWTHEQGYHLKFTVTNGEKSREIILPIKLRKLENI